MQLQLAHVGQQQYYPCMGIRDMLDIHVLKKNTTRAVQCNGVLWYLFSGYQNIWILCEQLTQATRLEAELTE
jgi:hypothetical protein